MANVPIHNGFFSTNITTYFSRPSKITKPAGSRNQSPRNRAGRRMTTHIPARTRSVVDPQRSNNTVRQSAYPRSRPTSWHPALVHDYQQFQSFPAYLRPQQYDMYGNTIVTHGLPTPNTFPVVDEGFLDCPNVPLDHMSSQDINTFSHNFQHAGVYADGSESEPFLFTSGATNMFANESMGLPTTPWPYFSTDFHHKIQTAPVSPDFLPLPEMGETFNVTYIDEVPDKDELVGMGLYDSPADVQSNSLLFGGCLPARRKSLKLEESFEPGPLSDEDENSEEPEQDEGSVVSAECQAETATIMPPTYMSTQLQGIHHGVVGDGCQPYMIPVDTLSAYPSMPLPMSQQIPGWY